jgi:hypothetical protein
MAKSKDTGQKRPDPMKLKTKDSRSFPEIISFPGGKEIVVQRPSSPAEMGVGDVGAIVVDAAEYLRDYRVGPDGPPPVIFSSPDGLFLMEVSNLSTEQEFWHRSLTHGELQFAHIGGRTVETEVNTVTQTAGQFIWFQKGIAHRNIGHGAKEGVDNLCLVIYIAQDLEVHEPPYKQPGYKSKAGKMTAREAAGIEAPMEEMEPAE